MFKNRLALTLLFSALLLTTHAQSQSTLELPFKNGIEMLLEKSLDVSIERLSPRIAGARVLSEEGAFDAEVFGSFKRQDSTTPLSARSSVAAGGLRSTESESYAFNAGLTGKTGLGTEYTLEVRNGWTADNFSGFEFEYESFTGARITQPLLRDYGTAGNLLNLTIARKDRDISIYRFKATVLGLVTDYGFAYWDLINAREELGVRLESQTLAETLLEINRKKLEAGAISRLELVQAEAAAASRRQDVILAENGVREAQKRLKDLIAGDNAYSIKDSEIVPFAEPVLRPVSQTLDESIAAAIDGRPDYQETKSTLEKNNIRVRYAKNQAYPRIDLEASYGYNGLGDSFSDSFRSIDENPEWSLGLLFRYPLGNRGARGSLLASRFESDQAVLRLKKLEQEIILGLDNSFKEIALNTRRVEAAETSVRLAAETLSAEEKKLEAGRSTTFNVLRIQEDLARARLNSIDAVSDYNRSLIQFYREKGTLLDELGVEVKGDGQGVYR